MSENILNTQKFPLPLALCVRQRDRTGSRALPPRPQFWQTNLTQITTQVTQMVKLFTELRYLWLVAIIIENCNLTSSSFLACNLDCVVPYVDIILHRGRFWAKSAALGSVRWCCFRSRWTVLTHMMRGRPGCLLQSAVGEANRILLASALSSMCIICPNRVSRCEWIIAMSLGCFVSPCTSFRTNWYHLT